ncbi:MAG: hypothetical protein MR908_05370 [Firmicutes bacterium]|nr:hypothetical protein [Bacillota bacterium]
MRREDKELQRLFENLGLLKTLQELKEETPGKLLEMYMECKKTAETGKYSKNVMYIITGLFMCAYRHAAGFERHKKSAPTNHD